MDAVHFFAKFEFGALPNPKPETILHSRTCSQLGGCSLSPPPLNLSLRPPPRSLALALARALYLSLSLPPPRPPHPPNPSSLALALYLSSLKASRIQILLGLDHENAVERIWHMQNSQGQILALTLR